MWWYTRIGTFVFRFSVGVGFSAEADGWYASIAGVVDGASTAAAAAGCSVDDEGTPLNTTASTRKLAMHNRAMVKILSPL